MTNSSLDDYQQLIEYDKKIALCFGYTSTNSIRQHRFRIRNKLTAGVDNSFLFDFIFKTKNSINIDI